ncbi:isoaspartyl peptidase/L-asparaginase [Chitinophaga sedimenti]|uniref:isoaspartyl peptidase/L-asparaginase family protein n=1 Tax=Chitinophaga sedimenti TaxID=2033606 RepID=UPI0020039EE6|nr:isoaspartyl peptidase/L-asparaginase [Chitinophaga sedimenti]MCK7556157.1 isoaspartyl peptidase/L-asparaginase [Chitinophaga sedimenti]
MTLQAAPADSLSATPKYVLVIHGGAGTILKSQMTPEREKAYIAALEQSLRAGYAVLSRGGTSLDAVEAAVRVMEDSPLFNAGKGAVFTNEGKNELDAAIMNGKTLEAGAVAGVTTIRNPVAAARAVMEKSQHVMMMGAGAEKFAQQAGLQIVDPSYFYTEDRWRGLQRAKAQDSLKAQLDHTDTSKAAARLGIGNHDYKFGTVGAVALDKAGNLAAATSTGGMTNKKFGRVGDAPIIGAGTYANNATCAISCTGWGEYFIRLSVAKTVSDLMEYRSLPVTTAADELIMKKVPALGGDGGLIALDKNGNMAWPFNTAGMYRGCITAEGKVEVKIYKE